jgi:hypothetical protein
MTEEQRAFVTGLAVGIVTTAMIVWMPLTLSLWAQTRDVREAAVKGGYARWEVVDLNTGATEFRWNVPAERK